MTAIQFKAKTDVVDTDLGGDRALLDLQKNTYFTLNPTAAEVWQAVQKPQTFEDVVTAVTEKFDVSADLCGPDIEQLLSDMVAAEIVERVEP